LADIHFAHAKTIVLVQDEHAHDLLGEVIAYGINEGRVQATNSP
jgi:hypothetical protein